MKKIWDIAVIGGGAAGLAAAIEAKRTAKTLSVLLLEKNASLGRKLAATGNGRCNLSNRACAEQETVLRFFAEAGIAVREEDGRLYPYNEDAREVAAVLTDRARRLGVEIQMNQEIQSMETLPHGGFHLFVTGSDAPVCARKVLIATGGKSYGQFGSTGVGYRFARTLGHRIVTPVPALTGIETVEDVSLLKGVRVKATVALYCGGRLYGQEAGEVQFRTDGLSGICVMNLSALVKPQKQAGRSIQEAFRDYRLVLDLMPDFDAAALQDLFRPVLQFPDAQNRDLLKTLVKAPLAEAVLGRAGIAPDAPAAQLTARQLQEIAAVLQGFTLTVRGLKGWNEAQVTAGGVSEAEVDAGHMESALVPGLYFAGEVMEYAGPCGGYNLHYAWLTGIRAGHAMAAALGTDR